MWGWGLPASSTFQLSSLSSSWSLQLKRNFNLILESTPSHLRFYCHGNGTRNCSWKSVSNIYHCLTCGFLILQQQAKTWKPERIHHEKTTKKWGMIGSEYNSRPATPTLVPHTVVDSKNDIAPVLATFSQMAIIVGFGVGFGNFNLFRLVGHNITFTVQ